MLGYDHDVFLPKKLLVSGLVSKMSLVERSLPALLSLDLSFDVGEMMIQFRGILTLDN